MQVNFTQTVAKYAEGLISRYNMLGGGRVLIALSGGSDSVTLLHYLVSRGGISVFAAHVNHMIRGDEALRDRDFCVNLCEKLNVPIFVLDFDVPKYAEDSKKSLEEAARDVRYGYFARICGEYNIKRVAVAHNAHDNIETIIFNMARGSSLSGMCGIPPVRPLGGGSDDDVLLVRPLLRCPKDIIYGYISENSLDYVTDSTNADTGYTRNYIRSKIIPHIKKLNASAEDAVSRMCEGIECDRDFIDTEVRSIPWDSSLQVLRGLHDALLTRFIKIRYCDQTGADVLERTHILEIVRLVRTDGADGKKIRSIALPRGIVCTVSETGIRFETESVFSANNEPYFYEIFPDSLTEIAESGNFVYISRNNEAENEKYINAHINIYKLFIHTQVSFDKINGRVYIRPRAAGDKYRMASVNRLVKKMLCDSKIPAAERQTLPFFCDSDGVFWIPHFNVCDRFSEIKVAHGGQEILHLYYIEVN